MSDLTNFRVEDLLYPESTLTFILESPHTKEVEVGYPAAGDTGINMSRVLLNRDEPIGFLLKNRADLPSVISILNCSRLPLQESCYGDFKLKSNFIDFLEIHKQNDKLVSNLKSKIKSILDTPVGKEAVNNFKIRLKEHLASSHNTKIVVCGVIAQCFFEKAISKQFRLHRPELVKWGSFSFDVFYEYHPSSTARRWTNSSNMSDLLGYVS